MRQVRRWKPRFRCMVAIGLLALGCGKAATPQPTRGGGGRAVTTPAVASEQPAQPGAARKLTHGKIEELGLDMTEREATDLLGPADAAVDGAETKTLRWFEGKRALDLTFSKQGRIRDISAQGLDQAPANLTRAKVDKIVNGALRRDVVHLLGPYQQIKIAKPGETILNWEDGAKFISLTFNDDRVVNKLVRGLE